MARDFKFRRVDKQHYEVTFLDVRIGAVCYREDAWSDAHWFIKGNRVFRTAGGVNGTKIKPSGFPTRRAAAYFLSTMQSAQVLSEMRR